MKKKLWLMLLAGTNVVFLSETVEMTPSKVLYQAVKEGSLDKVKKIIKHKKLDINTAQMSREGYILKWETALHAAVKNNDISMIRYLIDHGADVSMTDQDGNTPAHLAAISIPLTTELMRAQSYSKANSIKNLQDQTPQDIARSYTAQQQLQYIAKHPEAVKQGYRIMPMMN